MFEIDGSGRAKAILDPPENRFAELCAVQSGQHPLPAITSLDVGLDPATETGTEIDMIVQHDAEPDKAGLILATVFRKQLLLA